VRLVNFSKLDVLSSLPKFSEGLVSRYMVL
jgi:hypothetical protein